MEGKYASLNFRLEKIDEIRNYFLEQIKEHLFVSKDIKDL